MNLLPHNVLKAYRIGAFPMADSANNSNIKWYQPALRGQLSVERLHISRSLRKTLRNTHYTVTINTHFKDVIYKCAANTPARPHTWINSTIIDLFCTLNAQGHAHSVEVWDKSKLIGGLYGVQIGQIFCGESMFSRAPNTSKIALVHLAARLFYTGFKVLDTQYTNDHLIQFGVYEIPHEDYATLLEKYAHIPPQIAFDTHQISQTEMLEHYLKTRTL